jgi:phage terminase small subunit
LARAPTPAASGGAADPDPGTDTRGSAKAGRSVAGTAVRHAAFVEAYLTNGHNATAAATAIGCAGKQLANAAWKLLHHPNVQRLLAARSREVAELAQMNTENWAAWLCAVAFSDIGELFDGDGKLLPVPRLPPHVRAAISSVKVRRTEEKDEVVEYKFWDKVSALTVMARHLGLFERNNVQQQSDIRVTIELVG